MTIIRANIIDSIYNNSGFQKRDAKIIIESLLEIIKQTLGSGEDILISGSVNSPSKRKKPVKEETHKPRNLCNLMQGRWLIKCFGVLSENLNKKKKERNHGYYGWLKRLECRW